MVTIMMTNAMMEHFYLSKLITDAIYEASKLLTEEQSQNLLSNRGRFKITYEDVVTITPQIPELKSIPIPEQESELKPIPESELKPEQVIVKEPISKPPKISNPAPGTVSKTKAHDFDATEIIEKLASVKSTAEANEYLQNLKLKKPQYQAILEQGNVSMPKKNATKAEMEKRLIDAKVGTRLRSSVIQNTKVGYDK